METPLSSSRSGLSGLRIFIVTGVALFNVIGNTYPNTGQSIHSLDNPIKSSSNKVCAGNYIPRLLVESENQQPKVVGAPVISIIPSMSEIFLSIFNVSF